MGDIPWSDAYSSLLAYALLATQPADPARLRRLAGLPGPLGHVTAACFLLCPVPGQATPSVYQFVYHTAPVLLVQFSRVIQPQRLVSRGRIRGKVDWSSTYKARYTEDANPTVYVTQESRRHFDRPENQLFKYVLSRIQLCLERASLGLGSWQAWGQAARAGPGAPPRLGDYFASLVYRLRPLVTHVYLRDVALPAAIGERHLLAARTSKNKLYARVVDLYDLYRRVVDSPDPEQWTTLVRQILPIPAAAQEIGQLLTSLQTPETE